jgi:hypothetical protein
MLQTINEISLTGRVRNFIQSARKRLRDEKHTVFGTIKEIGLKRLDDDGTADLCDARINGVRRQNLDIAKTIACVDFNKLSPDKVRKVLTTQAQVGAIALATSLQSQRKLERKVVDHGRLECGDITRLFSPVKK